MKMKKLVLSSAAIATMLAATTAQAVDFKISGQINAAAIVGGDVKGDDISVVDNNMSGSRLRIVGTKEFGDLTAGFRYEIQKQDNKSSDAGASGSVGNTQEVRWAQAYIKGAFGKIGIGKSEGAASNVSDANFGNGNFHSTPQLVWLAYRGVYRDTIGDPEAGLFIPFDAAGRSNNIQYNSPSFGGFTFAASLSNEDQTEAAVRYAGKVGPGKLKARIGFSDSDTVDRTAFSAMYQISGFALGFSGGRDGNDSGNDYMGYHLAYRTGKVAFSIEGASDDKDREVTSFGGTYYPTKGLAIYANYSDFDITDGAMIGMKIDF